MMKIAILIVFASSFISSALASPTNCEQLTNSNIPFEMTLLNDTGENVTSQIYRSKNLYKTIFTKFKDKVTKTIMQANYVKSITYADKSDVTFQYDVPTDKYFFESNAAHTHVTMSGRNSQSTETAYQVIGEEDLFVEPCVFHTIHYTSSSHTESSEIILEIWLSKDVNSVMRSKNKITNKKTAQVAIHTLEAKSITADFMPFQK